MTHKNDHSDLVVGVEGDLPPKCRKYSKGKVMTIENDLGFQTRGGPGWLYINLKNVLEVKSFCESKRI